MTLQNNNSGSAPKTGLAKRMRSWMAARTGTKKQRRFTIAQICRELDIQSGAQRERLVNALGDFIRRKELIAYEVKLHGRRSPSYLERHKQVIKQYLYQHDWQAELKGSINRKIYKAMYVSHEFAASDIQRLTGLKDRDWLDRITKQLKDSGYIQQIRRRRCAHGAGAENIYNIVNRDKFKLEFLR